MIPRARATLTRNPPLVFPTIRHSFLKCKNKTEILISKFPIVSDFTSSHSLGQPDRDGDSESMPEIASKRLICTLDQRKRENASRENSPGISSDKFGRLGERDVRSGRIFQNECPERVSRTFTGRKGLECTHESPGVLRFPTAWGESD